MTNDRLGDLVLDTVLSEAHAVLQMVQNTKTLFLEGCENKGPEGMRFLTQAERTTAQENHEAEDKTHT